MYNLQKLILLYINEMFKLKINNSKPKDWPQIPLIIHNQMCNYVTMNTWDQMWVKTYQCQICNAGGWFISVRFSKFHDFSMTFDDFSKFHDFPWLFQKIVLFQVFQTLWEPCINTLRPRQNGRHFADDTFKHIFLKQNVRISIKISLNFVSKSPIDNIPALFQIMAWCRPGDKPLSEAIMVSLQTHIVARPQWVKPSEISTHSALP